MRPSAESLICGEQWSYEASQRFASLVNGCALMVKVFSIVHSILHVDVFRYSGKMEVMNIRDILIEECYAELAEDSYESKVCVIFHVFLLNMMGLGFSFYVRFRQEGVPQIPFKTFSFFFC